MQNVNLTRTLRRVDEEGKAIFDYMVYGVKDDGSRVDTILKYEDTAIIKDLNNLIETFITKEDELEILKKTVEYMSVSKAKEVDTGNAELDLPPSLNLPKTDKSETPATPNLPNNVDLPELEKEVLSKVEENKEV
ncbi:MAG: hypothetical protein E7J62_05785 [Serratia marcescens]|nr:hypothetical protein [Serratia marcescens]